MHCATSIRRAICSGSASTSWAGRTPPPSDEDVTGSADAVARRLSSGAAVEPPALASPSPALQQARRELASLYLSLNQSSKSIEKALEERVPTEAPNVSALLGPLLAARMIAQAGGLDRLAKLPASTIQVLGAERAFFEHLRGHAPPPRHGLLFLHPDIQSAPRTSRESWPGRWRAKWRSPLDWTARDARFARSCQPLSSTGPRRSAALGPRRGPRKGRRRSSGAPLHRAALDR